MERLKTEIDKKVEKEEKRKIKNPILTAKSPPMSKSGTLPNLIKIFGRPIFGKNRYSTLNENPKKISEIHNSVHTPIIRRDLPPEKAKYGRRTHYMKRSVSEMHLPLKFGAEKLDTDSDTGFSSLDSFDGESRDLETLV